GDGRARYVTGSYLDAYQAPAWDTWLFYFDDGGEGRRRAHQHWEAEWIVRRKVTPVAFASYLVAWVPPTLIPAVEWGYNLSANGPVAWAEGVDCELPAQLRARGWLADGALCQPRQRREEWMGHTVQRDRTLRGGRPLVP